MNEFRFAVNSHTRQKSSFAILAKAVLLSSFLAPGCGSPSHGPSYRMSGRVLGCEMAYSTTDAGFIMCQCSSAGVSPGSKVIAYKAEVEYGTNGDPLGCLISEDGSPVATATADSHGFYSLRLPRGHYNIFHTAGCAESPPPGYPYYYSCEAVDGDLTVDINPCRGIGCLPNLYLYPATPEILSVGLVPGPGAALLTQSPDFDRLGLWNVYVEPGSRILQSPAGFLFYEARVGQPPRTDRAWILPPHGARRWIAETLPCLGWPARPLRDFRIAWEARLDRDYPIAISLIPQRWVNSRIGLRLDPAPDRVQRYWFLIERASGGAKGSPPRPPVFDERSGGFDVLEWGVIDDLPKL